MRILLIEDDTLIGDGLKTGLSKMGFSIDWFTEGRQGKEALYSAPYDAVILDLMLPGVDGLEICRRIRQQTRYLPVIIISARASETQRVQGLEMGADDYLAKPFSILELTARVKAVFRRQEAMGQNLLMDAGRIASHGLSIDPLSRDVKLRGETVDLTPREFDLLYYFARHPGEVFSRLELLDRVWGYQHDGYEHTVNTHINRLRTKIERDPAEPDIILTVWGKGYKFAVERKEAQP